MRIPFGRHEGAINQRRLTNVGVKNNSAIMGGAEPVTLTITEMDLSILCTAMRMYNAKVKDSNERLWPRCDVLWGYLAGVRDSARARQLQEMLLTDRI